ncbi:PucR family transcriptional regulator [Paenibacillus sp. HW567]|uniref:PucR family transcriptional regulator n=1 Tax=Paenibacillus sp. HW567 TaxID=1034769 RepID=UPI00037DC117|nr:helix-turn-helix domain-containing protein [Paenibacillus sp. HW567]
MSISFEQLAGHFGNRAVHVHHNSKLKADYIDAKLITKSQTCFAPEFIYVGKSSMLPGDAGNIENASFMLINDAVLPVREYAASSPNRIEFQAGEDLFEIYNQTRELFLENFETEQAKAELLKAFVAGKGMDHIVSVAAELLGNPVIIIDLSYKVLAYSDSAEITDPIWRDNLQKGYCSYDFIATVKKMKSVQNGVKSVEPYEVICSGSAAVKVVAKVKIGNKLVGNVILLGCRRVIHPRDHDLAAFVSEMVAAELQKISFYRNSTHAVYEEMIYDLLENDPGGKELTEERLRSCNIKLNGKLSVLVLDITRYDATDKYNGYLRDRISTFFKAERLIFYNEHIVIVRDRELRGAARMEFSSDMHEFLTSNQIRLGISSEFTDIADCRKYYLQAVKALEIGLITMPADPVVLYPDVQMYDMLSFYTQSDYRDVCHPALLTLREYDMKHHTDLYHTLFIYLKNNRQLQKTAARMFIHRNTLRYRLQQISELTHADLDNIDNVLRLYMSYKMTAYLDKVREAGGGTNR